MSETLISLKAVDMYGGRFIAKLQRWYNDSQQEDKADENSLPWVWIRDRVAVLVVKRENLQVRTLGSTCWSAKT